MTRICLLCLLIYCLGSSPIFANEVHDNCKQAFRLVMEGAWEGSLSNEQIDTALDLCKLSGELGKLSSIYDVSLLYYLKNDEKENQNSYRWCLRAAEKGHDYAQFRIGKMYSAGIVLEYDLNKADYWYNKSAKNGFVLAQRELGYNYTNNIPANSDYLKGIYWYEKAAEQDDKNSKNFLIKFYSNGTAIYPPNKEKADYWLKKINQ